MVGRWADGPMGCPLSTGECWIALMGSAIASCASMSFFILDNFSRGEREEEDLFCGNFFFCVLVKTSTLSGLLWLVRRLQQCGER